MRETTLPRRSVGGDLGEVDGHGRGGAADGEAEDEAEQCEHLPRRGQHTADRADHEDDREHQDVVPASEPVGHPSADQSADRGTEDQDAHDEALGERGQLEVSLQRFECAVDDSGVVSEEQAAEGGDDGDDAESVRVPPRGVGRQGRGGSSGEIAGHEHLLDVIYVQNT